MGNTIKKFRDLVERNAFTTANINKYFSLENEEKEIFQLIAKGKKFHEISDQLFISLYDVENYWKNTKAKLNIKSNNDILRFSHSLQLEKSH